MKLMGIFNRVSHRTEKQARMNTSFLRGDGEGKERERERERERESGFGVHYIPLLCAVQPAIFITLLQYAVNLMWPFVIG